jgi:mRNA interferase RelE/StbE
MNHILSPTAEESYLKAPPAVQKAFDKQIKFLLQNLHHPSLRAKKYDEANNRWQARVTLSWRFYFKIVGDIYYILDIIPHPK